jgi:hypothetical protein
MLAPEVVLPDPVLPPPPLPFPFRLPLPLLVLVGRAAGRRGLPMSA